MFKKTAVLSLMVLFVSTGFLFSTLFAAQNDDVLISVTTARRMIVNHNIQQAKQQAVSDALGIALQKAYVQLISRQVLASNLAFFYDNVLPHTSDYIITYQVFGGFESKEYYLVGVESKIDLKLLEKNMTQARILNAKKDKPSILFFITEKMSSDEVPRYWWGKDSVSGELISEKIIAGKMIQDRFAVVGNGKDRPDPLFYNIKFNSIYDVQAAKNLGREMKADMIVFGTAVSSEAINRMGEDKTFHAQIDLEGYNLETGEKVVASQIQAVTKNTDVRQGNIQAMVKAAELSSLDLSQKIDAYWQKNLRKEHAFDVKLEGENFLSRFIALKQQFKQMPGIVNMQPKEMGSNSAVMEMLYKGETTQFADALMLKTFGSFGLEILEVTDSLVTIRFIEKAEPAGSGNTSRILSAPLEEKPVNKVE